MNTNVGLLNLIIAVMNAQPAALTSSDNSITTLYQLVAVTSYASVGGATQAYGSLFVSVCVRS